MNTVECSVKLITESVLEETRQWLTMTDDLNSSCYISYTTSLISRTSLGKEVMVWKGSVGCCVVESQARDLNDHLGLGQSYFPLHDSFSRIKGHLLKPQYNTYLSRVCLKFCNIRDKSLCRGI